VLKRRKRKKGRPVNKFRIVSFLNILTLTILFALQCILLPACGSEESQTDKKYKIVGKKKAAKKKSAVKKIKVKTVSKEKNTLEDYFYDATGKPDPFVPLITEIEPPRKPDEQFTQRTPLTPLQKYSLDELKLVAIIKSGERYSALFEDLSEFGYIVKENTLIGNNEGVIRKITYDKVIVEEKAYNASGELEKTIRSLKIQQQE